MFLYRQCKEIQEISRVGNTRDLLKELEDTKGNFHATMGTIKERECKHLKEGEYNKKRWQEYTEELYRKCLTTQITTVVWLLT